jgi:ABC-type phosphate/phosphonate transport system substrate-binding protein
LYHYEIDVVFDKNLKEMIQLFQEGHLDYIGMTMCSFNEHFEELIDFTDRIYSASSDIKARERYVMLTTLPQTPSKSWEGKKVTLQDKECNAMMYADMTSMTHLKKRSKESFNFDFVETPTRAILKLFFDQADIAFVPERSWELSKEMNPKMAEKIRVIETSPAAFIFGVELYHKNIPSHMKPIFDRANEELESLDEGKQLLRIMKIANHQAIDKTKIEGFMGYYFEYKKRLKNTKAITP